MAASNLLRMIVDRFEANLGKVQQLMGFDRVILDFVLARLKPTAEFQKQFKYVPPGENLKSIYQAIENVKTNESLSIQYREIYNQGLVLAVSHFTSTTRELFKAVVVGLLTQGHPPKKLQQQKLDVSVWQLVQKAGDIPSYIASQLIDHSDMSFQDMQSINRGFRDFCAYDPPRDNHVNNIILGQAFRHAIVHNGGLIDEQVVNQVSGARPRDIREAVVVGSQIQMTPRDVELIGTSMIHFLRGIAARFQN